MAKKPNQPWEKPAPKKGRTTKLTPQTKAKAKAAATTAGRKYPNLVDNMNAAKEQP
jgi:ribosomal protein L15E